MINIADLPAVRAQLERDAAPANEVPVTAEQAIQYARAPAASGEQQTGARPPAVQGGAR